VRFKIVLLPALVMFVASSYLLCLKSLGTQTMQKTLVTMAFDLSIAGTVLTIFWFLLVFPSFYSSFCQRKKTTNLDFNKYTHTRSLIPYPSFANLVAASLVLLGTAILLWMTQITWNDISVWNKSISPIFFGSRTGENISLGIDMKVIHYFLTSFTLLIFGSLIFIYRRLQRERTYPMTYSKV
jgi:hypothetical protein